ncbi:MAG: hypothetical protein J0I69_14780 [Altererythrobacter sp.]|nr:hypothetical protein [Altererythrobacter sp.]
MTPVTLSGPETPETVTLGHETVTLRHQTVTLRAKVSPCRASVAAFTAPIRRPAGSSGAAKGVSLDRAEDIAGLNQKTAV